MRAAGAEGGFAEGGASRRGPLARKAAMRKAALRTDRRDPSQTAVAAQPRPRAKGAPPEGRRPEA
jgi:hypothetical protein